MPEITNHPLPRMMSIARVAAELDCHPETIRRAIRAGKLACYRMGRCTRITQEQLQAYLDATLCPVREPESDSSTYSFIDKFRQDMSIKAALEKRRVKGA